MPFLVESEFYNVIRQYQLDAITGGDITIVPTAIDIAIDEVTNIFTPNDMKIWKDGRPIYDIATVFAAVGAARNPFILVHTKVVALWHLILLCNTGLSYDEIKDRYDRTIETLSKLASGETNSATLPKIIIPEPDDEIPFVSGSNRKFNHGNNY